jgi:hypothetical protein
VANSVSFRIVMVILFVWVMGDYYVNHRPATPYASHATLQSRQYENRPSTNQQSAPAKHDSAHPPPIGFEQAQAQEHPNAPADDGKSNQRPPIDLVQLAIAVFAALTAIIYGLQTWLMRTTLVRTNRAYIFPETFHDELISGQDGRPHIRLRPPWRNAGNTPPRRMTNYVSHEMRVCPLPTDFGFPDIVPEVPAPLFVGPRGIVWAMRIDLPPEHVLALRLKLMRMYLWGWTNYRDVFRWTHWHRTEFCVEVLDCRNL